MIPYKSFTTESGLRVIFNQDKSTPLVAVNLLYKVGAKHENPDVTGLAHLCEHLMFSSSKTFGSYDKVTERLGGESNAFTNNDFTNYYVTLPAEFFKYALALEADRMYNLELTQKNLDIQKGVVIEEFKQRYINQPYGDLWKEIRELAYKVHPYRWQTIGKDISHIENATLQQTREFYDRFYAPSNAVLAISGNLKEEEVREAAEKYFPKRKSSSDNITNYPSEPEQTENRTKTVYRDVPANMICIMFPMSKRTEKEYYVQDLLSDVLANGKSSRMYNNLVTERKLFTGVNASITGEDDAGLFIVTGQYCDGIPVKEGEQALWEELGVLTREMVSEKELQKMKNKNEALSTFEDIKILDKAMKMAYYSHLNMEEYINGEREIYNAITVEQLRNEAEKMFLKGKYSCLYYLKENENENKD